MVVRDSIGPDLQLIGARVPSRKAITRILTLWYVNISRNLSSQISVVRDSYSQMVGHTGIVHADMTLTQFFKVTGLLNF